MIEVKILLGDLDRDHLGSPEVTNRFLLISHGRKELGAWAWSHCACHDGPTDMQHDLFGSMCGFTCP